MTTRRRVLAQRRRRTSLAQLSGVVIGGEVANAWQTADGFGAWRGREAGVAVDYAYPSGGSAVRLQQYGGHLTPESRTGWIASGKPLIWSTQAGRMGDPPNAASIAAGDFDAQFQGTAQELIDYGAGNAIIRPLWENDGSWFPWAAQYTTGGTNTAAAVRDAFRRASDVFRAVPGNNFKIEWNTGTYNGFDPTGIDPGNSYYDYVGFDKYGDRYFNEFASDEQVWNHFREEFDFMANYARARDRPLSVSEWGVQYRFEQIIGSGVNAGETIGTDDNPTYVQRMLEWLQANDDIVAIDCYFNGFDFNKQATTLDAAVAAGATSLHVADGTKAYSRGALRMGPASATREITYTGRTFDSGTTGPATLTGIPSSGVGSVPAGGYASGTTVEYVVKHDFAMVVGPEGDHLDLSTTRRDNPRFPLSAAAYREFHTALGQ